MPPSLPTVLDVGAGSTLLLASAVPGAAVHEGAPVQIVRTDVDTDDARLAAHGTSLCHLAVDRPADAAWILEVAGAGTLGRWPGGRDDIPAEAQRLLHGLTGGRDVVPSGVTVVTRRRHRVERSDRVLLAEVVAEVVDGPDGRYRTLEVLPGDDPSGARLLTKALRRAGAARHRVPSSASAGRRAGRQALTTFAGTVISDGLHRLLAEDPLLRLDVDGGAVHRARVATRRLRADLKTLHEVLDPAWDEQARSGLRWLGERLGAVRDADVLATRLQARATDDSAFPGLPGLVDVALDQRRVAAGELLVALDSPRYLALLDLLEQHTTRPINAEQPGDRRDGDGDHPATASVAPTDDARHALPTLVGGRWRRLQRQVRTLTDQPGDEALHRVRIRAKEVRYAAEAATPVMGRRAAAIADAAKTLQTVLGDHHDAVAAEQWLRAVAGGADAEVAFAAGVLVAVERAEQQRLRSAWHDQWKTLRVRARAGLGG